MTDRRTEGQREDRGGAESSSALCQSGWMDGWSVGWMDWESPGRQGESGVGGVCARVIVRGGREGGSKGE